MTEEWRNYQANVAKFFESLDFIVEENATIKGMRGKHKIDVWVTFQRFNLQHKWVIECKYWKTNIPKEKVLALNQIVQDVGADKGFLLSEKGFQSGAIKACEKTNITLTSLKDLEENAENEILKSMLSKIMQEIFELEERSSSFYTTTVTHRKRHRDGYSSSSTTSPRAGLDVGSYFNMVGQLSFLEMGFKNVRLGKFPALMGCDIKKGGMYAENSKAFLLYAREKISSIRFWIETQEKNIAVAACVNPKPDAVRSVNRTASDGEG